jgi:hypothetical protein
MTMRTTASAALVAAEAVGHHDLRECAAHVNVPTLVRTARWTRSFPRKRASGWLETCQRSSATWSGQIAAIARS